MSSRDPVINMAAAARALARATGPVSEYQLAEIIGVKRGAARKYVLAFQAEGIAQRAGTVKSAKGRNVFAWEWVR